MAYVHKTTLCRISAYRSLTYARSSSASLEWESLSSHRSLHQALLDLCVISAGVNLDSLLEVICLLMRYGTVRSSLTIFGLDLDFAPFFEVDGDASS